MKIISTNPAKNYEVIGEVEQTTREELEDIVDRARIAQREWAKKSLKERIADIATFVELLKENREELARMIATEIGRPITSSREDVDRGVGFFESYFQIAESVLSPKVIAEDATSIHEVHHEPIGVIAVISPWNAPTWGIGTQCGQALIAGNTVIYKTSEENILYSTIIAKLVAQSKLPKDVFSVVYGDGMVGEKLALSNVDKIKFTGSYVIGQKLTEIAARKFIPITTELGGSSACIVFEDALLDDGEINSIYSQRFINCGQFCTNIKRLIVHESRFDEVVEKLRAVISAKKIGDPLQEDTDFGPLAAKKQLDKIQEQVNDAVNKGAKIVIGGKSPTALQGAYFEPTILTNISFDMKVWKEEVFGPVLPVVPFKHEAEAINLANDTSYGLTAYIATIDKERFSRVASQMQSGLVQQPGTSNTPMRPFGGYKHSGMGRQNGEFGFYDVTQRKAISKFR